MHLYKSTAPRFSVGEQKGKWQEEKTGSVSFRSRTMDIRCLMSDSREPAQTPKAVTNKSPFMNHTSFDLQISSS